ncbi:MAG: response regulator transcription factor [Chloroflexi bacterium]|nr:response regulator transcription factor [Chloroflexota bacterium]
MVTIVLADDSAIVRRGARALLEQEPDFQLTGEASSGQEALELVKELAPDVLVTDLEMADMSGIALAKRVREVSPKTVVIMFSMYRAAEYVAEALKAGARGYVVKGSHASELVQAIREVTAGRQYLGQLLSPRGIPGDTKNSKPSRSARPVQKPEHKKDC